MHCSWLFLLAFNFIGYLLRKILLNVQKLLQWTNSQSVRSASQLVTAVQVSMFEISNFFLSLYSWNLKGAFIDFKLKSSMSTDHLNSSFKSCQNLAEILVRSFQYLWITTHYSLRIIWTLSFLIFWKFGTLIQRTFSEFTSKEIKLLYGFYVRARCNGIWFERLAFDGKTPNIQKTPLAGHLLPEKDTMF